MENDEYGATCCRFNDMIWALYAKQNDEHPVATGFHGLNEGEPLRNALLSGFVVCDTNSVRKVWCPQFHSNRVQFIDLTINASYDPLLVKALILFYSSDIRELTLEQAIKTPVPKEWLLKFVSSHELSLDELAYDEKRVTQILQARRV